MRSATVYRFQIPSGWYICIPRLGAANRLLGCTPPKAALSPKRGFNRVHAQQRSSHRRSQSSSSQKHNAAQEYIDTIAIRNRTVWPTVNHCLIRFQRVLSVIGGSGSGGVYDQFMYESPPMLPLWVVANSIAQPGGPQTKGDVLVLCATLPDMPLQLDPYP